MILTGNEIKLQREAGNIVISDWEESRLGKLPPNRVPLHKYSDSFV